MKNRRKWIMAGVIAIGALGVAFGCSMAMRPGNGDGNKENSKPLDHYRAITLGNMPEGGMDEIYEQLDALTIPELNCTLRFEFIPWGNEKQQLNIVTASGEYDFIPGGVLSDYRTLVFKNAFLDLNEYLWAVPQLTEHYAIFDEDTLKKCEINGGQAVFSWFLTAVCLSDILSHSDTSPSVLLVLFSSFAPLILQSA